MQDLFLFEGCWACYSRFQRDHCGMDGTLIKFIYSEKVTNFCGISTVDLSHVVTVKFKLEISQNFVAFSEYMNFLKTLIIRVD